jgi:hypothetical protein
MKFALIKNNDNSFSTPYNSDYEKASKLKVGVEYECTIVKKRNPKFHRLYFSLLNMVFQNQDYYTNIEDLRHDLTVEAGFYSLRSDLQGNIIKKPHSISFSKMDDEQFANLYDKTLSVILLFFKFDKEDIEKNIEQYY